MLMLILPVLALLIPTQPMIILMLILSVLSLLIPT
jgi:hypothetical protein